MRASDRVYETLRQEIVQWRLVPGTALQEVELAERLGTSRTPVREALSRLVADNLAERSGSRISVTEVSLESVDQLFVLREALEIPSARLAAAHADPAVFLDLAARFREAGRTSLQRDVGQYYDLAAQLDAALDDAAANPYLARAQTQMRGHLARIRRLSREDGGRLRASAQEHAAIADAVAARDPDLAASYTLIHLRAARAHVTGHPDVHAHFAGTHLDEGAVPA